MKIFFGGGILVKWDGRRKPFFTPIHFIQWYQIPFRNFIFIPASLSMRANSTAGFKARNFLGVRVQMRSELFSKPPQIRFESSENVTVFNLKVYERLSVYP